MALSSGGCARSNDAALTARAAGRRCVGFHLCCLCLHSLLLQAVVARVQDEQGSIAGGYLHNLPKPCSKLATEALSWLVVEQIRAFAVAAEMSHVLQSRVVLPGVLKQAPSLNKATADVRTICPSAATAQRSRAYCHDNSKPSAVCSAQRL